MKDSEVLSVLRDALRDLSGAKKLDCACTSFVLQYQGCSCKKGKEITKAENKVWKILGWVKDGGYMDIGMRNEE